MNIPILLSFNIILGTMITVSSSSWLMAWLGLELNALSFMPFMKSKNNLFSIEASMKYFLIQAITSSMFIMMILQFSLNMLPFSNHYSLTFVILVLSMKMALMPLHFWLPSMANSLSWNPLLTILTWQKIAPLSILSNLSYNFSLLASLNMFMGAMLMINQTSIKKLLVYSSITHLGWVLSPSPNIMLSSMYFFSYSLISMTLIFLLKFSKIFHIYQLPYSKYPFFISFSLNILAMVGFPPFLMFFPKLLIILKSLYISNWMTLIMILSSLIAMFAYFQILWPYLLKNLNFSKLFYNIPASMSPYTIVLMPMMHLLTPLPLLYLMMM